MPKTVLIIDQSKCNEPEWKEKKKMEKEGNVFIFHELLFLLARLEKWFLDFGMLLVIIEIELRPYSFSFIFLELF